MSAARFTRREALRRSALLLLVGAGGSILSACAGTPATPTTAPAATPAANATSAPAGASTPAAQPAASGQSITLNWVTPAAVGLEQDFYNSFKDDFVKQNPNYKIEVSYEAWNDYFVKLPTLLAGGTIPDVNHLHCSISNDYGTKGAMKNMYEFMDRDKVSRDAFFGFLTKQLSDFKTHTKLWAIPKDSAAYGIYYNKDMFDAVKQPYPKNDWSLDDMVAASKALTIDQSGKQATQSGFDATKIKQWGWGWTDPLPSGDQGNQFAWAVAGPWYSDDFSKANFDDADHIAYIQKMADMRNVDHSAPAAGDALGQGDAWRNGLVAMKIDHHQNVFFMEQEKKTFNYDCVYTPSGKLGQFLGAACSGWTIAAKAKNPDNSWPFVKFLVSEDKQCQIVSSRRWGSAVKACESKLIPPNGVPVQFKPVFVDPLMGEAKATTREIPYPPYLSEIKQVMATEFDGVVNGGSVKAADAAKKAQPQIQALLDKGQKLTAG